MNMLSSVRDALRERDAGTIRLVIAVVAGFFTGLATVIFRDVVVPESFGRDSLKIWKIANDLAPNFEDESFTPVATVYRWLGLADDPTAAALAGFLIASVVIGIAVYAGRQIRTTWLGAAFIFGSFILSALFLGQYSKDVFVLPVVAIFLLLPRRIYWDIAGIAAIAAYAYWFRTYWFLLIVAYLGYRVFTWVQPRLRYMLVAGSLAAGIAGLGVAIALGKSPDHFRTKSQADLRVDANTALQPLFNGLPDPLGGVLDVIAAYWLILVPVVLPFTAGVIFAVVAVGTAFMRVLPLAGLRSSQRWPDDARGVTIRRLLSLLLGFAVIQALFEPDYGSVLRHYAAMLPLAIALIQLAPSSCTPRVGKARPWSWTGAGITPDASAR